MIDRDPVTDEVTTDVYGCARCEGTHEQLVFRPLTHPLELPAIADADGRVGQLDHVEPLTHWAPCPTNGEPILLRVVNEEAAE